MAVEVQYQQKNYENCQKEPGKVLLFMQIFNLRKMHNHFRMGKKKPGSWVHKTIRQTKHLEGVGGGG
jgi:hypothetical protein